MDATRWTNTGDVSYAQYMLTKLPNNLWMIHTLNSSGTAIDEQHEWPSEIILYDDDSNPIAKVVATTRMTDMIALTS